MSKKYKVLKSWFAAKEGEVLHTGAIEKALFNNDELAVIEPIGFDQALQEGCFVEVNDRWVPRDNWRGEYER